MTCNMMIYDVIAYNVMTYDAMTYDFMTYDVMTQIVMAYDVMKYDIIKYDIMSNYFFLLRNSKKSQHGYVKSQHVLWEHAEVILDHSLNFYQSYKGAWHKKKQVLL